MTVKERKKQLRSYKFWVAWILFTIICFIPTFNKYFGCELQNEVPVAGVSAYLSDLSSYAFNNPTVEEKEVEIVEESSEEQSEEIDLTCRKKYKATRFRKLGRVKYGKHTYTYYSEKVLPGKGLNKYIKDRHLEYIDGLPFVCNGDGYIVVACDFLSRYSIVDTPIGRKGIVIDTGAGKNNIDIYVSW